VDQYFKIIEDLGEQIETLQDAVIENPEPSSLAIIQNLKKEILFLRKSIWPLREIINALTRGESELIRNETVIFLRDVYDHTIQIIDTIETFRDMLSGTLDIYLSNVSNRMNEVMKEPIAKVARTKCKIDTHGFLVAHRTIFEPPILKSILLQPF
jgi:magnesium transporter